MVRTTRDLRRFTAITSLGDSCFAYCTGIEEIILPPNIRSLGGSCFRGLTKIAEVALPHIVALGTGCFRSDNNNIFKRVHLGNINNSTSGGYRWFQESRLRLCELGSSVVRLSSSGNNGIFGRIQGTTSSDRFKLVIHTKTPPTRTDNLFAQTSYYSIYVPDVSVDAYKTSSEWSTFASNIHPIIEYPNPSELLYLE